MQILPRMSRTCSGERRRARTKLRFVEGNYGSTARYKHSVDRSAQVIEDAPMRMGVAEGCMHDADGNYGSCSNAVYVGRNSSVELRSSIDDCRIATSSRALAAG